MKRKTNIFDKIGTLIPEYKGYQERDERRECDRQLREQIADMLSETEKKFMVIMENVDIKSLTDTEKIRKKINNLKDLIRYSSYGASSFFSDSEIKENELESIYKMDLDVFDAAENLQKNIIAKNLDVVKRDVESLENSINKRNQYLKDL